MKDREGKMRSVLSAVCKPIDLHKRRCERHLCPRFWSSLALCVCVGVCIVQARSHASAWLFLCVHGITEAISDELCRQWELSYAHTEHKPILLSILSDLCFLCHVKTVTGVSPKANTLYHCLPLYLSVLIYCCSSLEWSGNIAVNLVTTLGLCHSPSPCNPCR